MWLRGLLPDVITYAQWSCRGRSVVLRHDQAVGIQPNVVTYCAVVNPCQCASGHWARASLLPWLGRNLASRQWFPLVVGVALNADYLNKPELPGPLPKALQVPRQVMPGRPQWELCSAS